MLANSSCKDSGMVSSGSKGFRNFRILHSSQRQREGARPEVTRDILGHARIAVTQNIRAELVFTLQAAIGGISRAAYSTLRGMPKLPHPVSRLPQPVSQRVLSHANDTWLFAGICVVLLLQERKRASSVEMERREGLRDIERSLRSWLWDTRRGCANRYSAAECVGS